MAKGGRTDVTQGPVPVRRKVLDSWPLTRVRPAKGKGRDHVIFLVTLRVDTCQSLHLSDALMQFHSTAGGMAAVILRV